MKVVYNACFGGFGISKEGMELYFKKRGIEVFSITTDDVFKMDYYFDELPSDLIVEGLNYDSSEKLKGKAWRWVKQHRLPENGYIPRHDSKLVEVVEELGSKASNKHAQLEVAEISGDEYRIDEYDGNESVETRDSYEWISG